MAQCKFKGKQRACKARPMAGSDFCWFHDPARAKERKIARSLGGSNSRAICQPPLPVKKPQTASEAAALAAEIATALLQRRIDPRTARAATHALTQFLRAVEVHELEQRLSRLENERTSEKSSQ